jgi:predicted lactoylglutathione lyase
MQQTTAAEHFYWQAFSTSNAITLIYEYAFTPLQTNNLPMLQTYLYNHYNISITIEGLTYMISTISQEIQKQPPTLPMNPKQSKPFETLITTLLHHAGIPFPPELFSMAQQIKRTFVESSQEKHVMILSKRMSWMQLEEFFYQYFQDQGYEVTKTKRSHDKGVDLLLRRDNEFIAVQIKKRAKPSGIRGVQEIHTGGVFYGTNRAILISTSGFTRDALQLADKVQVKCWDEGRLLKELYKQQVFYPPE